MAVFRLTLLPASDGDCMFLSWGDEETLHHILIDGGRTGAYPSVFARLQEIKARGEQLHLLVLTHIDGDHLGGALTYLRDKRRPIAPSNVWFNGYRQIRGAGFRSMKQGDEVSKLLDQLKWPLNMQFEAGAVSIESAPAEIDVAGLKLRIVSPTIAGLRALGDDWERWRVIEENPIRTGGVRGRAGPKRPVPDPLIVEDLIADGVTDTELPNGSSIALIAEWHNVRVLLAGDAHPDVLVAALAPFAARDGGRIRIDLLKASHHGSMKNTSRELVEMLDCRRVAISTNGTIHGHPDPESIARFIHFGTAGHKIAYFNYQTSKTLPWGSALAQERYDYVARFPARGQDGTLEIDLFESADPLGDKDMQKPGCGDAAA